MKQKKKKQTAYWLKVAVIGITLGFALQFVRAWTEPTQAPPGGNVNAPINTGSQAQTKDGSLNILGLLGIGNNSPTQQVDANGYIKSRTGFCINDSCITAWPSGTTTTPPSTPCLCSTDPFGGGSVYACGSTFNYCDMPNAPWCYCVARCDSPNSWTMGLPCGCVFGCP